MAICIISANCQGAYIQALLRAHAEFGHDFELHYYVNYEKLVIPAELLARCDLLIYQPLSADWGALANDRLLAAVPAGCKRIAINYLTFPIYWPGFAIDPRNKPSEAFPFGPFPYGDRSVVEALSAGKSVTFAAESFSGPDYLSGIDLRGVITTYVESQRGIETRRDQRLLDYIMAQYQKVKLFETYNHPAQPLCIYQVNNLLEMLGYRALSVQEELPLDYLKDNQQPIHPDVARALGLEFEAKEDTLYQVWGRPMFFRAFATAYANWDTRAIGGDLDTPSEQVKAGGDPVQRLPKLKSVPVTVDSQTENKQWVFLHIPKTAGTSLNDMFDEALGGSPAQHYNSTTALMKDAKRRGHRLIRGHIFYAATGALRNERLIFTFLRDPIDRTISAFEFMKSHPETWLGKLAQGSITEFLSDPFVCQTIANLQTRMLGLDLDIQRLYARLLSKDLTIEQYLSQFTNIILLPPDDGMLKRACERLLSMLHVGFTESFAEDSQRLFTKLSLPSPSVRQSNRTPDAHRRRGSYTCEELEMVRGKNNLDEALYAEAKALRERGLI